jgi:hypothetical protein
MQITNAARFIIVILCLMLLIPAVGIALQNPAALETFHNRTLSKWPAGTTFSQDPARYFLQVRKWLADRGYPIIAATHFYKLIKLYVLMTPPEKRLTLGLHGFIFLNGGSEHDINGTFEAICVGSHRDDTVARFKSSFAVIADYMQRTNVSVDVIVFPTMQTLYADYLPLSVPQKYREACRARSPLIDTQRSSNPLVIFPMQEMINGRDDPAFFPKGNWHARGLSIKTVRDSYLKHLGINQSVKDDLKLTTEPSELLSPYNIDWELPTYKVINPDVQVDRASASALRNAIADLFDSPRFVVQAYKNQSSIIPTTALMISDSFGNASAAIFAGAFRELLHVTTTDMKAKHLPELLKRVAVFGRIDRIIMLVEEGGTDIVVAWSNSLKRSGD